MTFSYEHAGKRYTVELTSQPDGSVSARIDGRALDCMVTPLGPGRWLLEIGGQRLLVHGAAAANARLLHVDGRHYRLETVDERARRRKQAGAAGELAATMPGRITNVPVSAGQEVARGQTLVVMEAMKMEIRIAAPAEGVVRRVAAAVGDVVERGQVLVELDLS